MLLLVGAMVGCGAEPGEPAASTAVGGSSSSTTSGGATTETEVTVRSDIQYGTGEVGAPEAVTVPLLMDVYEPPGEADGPRPVVVVIHGGGFTQQSKTDPGIVRIAQGLAARGIVAVSIDYRLIPQGPVPSERVSPLIDALPDGDLFAAMASAVDDTLAATDHLADHADELDIDIGRLGLVGSSAGAITADHVAYALDDHGVDAPDVRVVGSLWGGIFASPPAGGDGSGASQLQSGEAALFAVHGDADERVPVILSDELAARAEVEGVTNEYHRIPGGVHGYEGSRFFTEVVDGDQTSFDRLLTFVAEQLGPH